MEHQEKTDLFAQTNTYQLDPEINRSITHFLNSHPALEKAPKGDWLQLRKMGDQLYTYMNEHLPLNAHVRRKDLEMIATDQSVIKLRWFSFEETAKKSPAVIFVHGGARISGSVDLYDRVVADYVYRSKVPFLSVDYGLAAETECR